jgi:phosphopantetheine adenylyltransferase
MQLTMDGTPGAGDEKLSLLLLPEPPSDVSIVTFRAAYGPALTQVIKLLASRSTAEHSSKLDIGLACSSAIGIQTAGSRAIIYSQAQHFIGLLYRLTCYICTQENVDLIYDNDVDIRIILVGGNTTFSPSQGDNNGSDTGPFIDIAKLALSRRPWSSVYAIESEEGEDVLQHYLARRTETTTTTRIPYPFKIERLAGGPIIRNTAVSQPVKVADELNQKRHFSVAVGGTFDHLHAGHKLLLTATALVLEPINNSGDPQERCLTIGIAGDELLRNKKYAEELESWEIRQAAVCQFLLDIMHFGQPANGIQKSERYSHEGPNGKAIHYKLESGIVVNCVEISDPFGPTITDESITALIVSGETRAGGKAVNDKRRGKGWDELEVFEVDVLDMSSQGETSSSDDGQYESKISSTEIRRRLHEKKKGSV